MSMIEKVKRFLRRINQISTPIGGIGWDSKNNEAPSESSSATELPRIYSPSLVREIIRKSYDDTTGFIAVKYGSAIHGHGNDEDYLVLVFSKPTEQPPITLLITHADKTWHEHETAIDLTFREFHSFVFGLVLGRPYEHSVAEDGQIVDSAITPRSYWAWIQALKDNIQINTNTLRQHLIDIDFPVAVRLFNEGKTEKNIHKVVVGAYSAVCILLQTKLLPNDRPLIYSEDVYPLSQVSFMRNGLESFYIQQTFDLIVSAAKRSVAPVAPNEFIQRCEKMINELRGIL